MKLLRFFLLSVFLCAGMLAVNSCGDDDDDDTQSSTPTNNDNQGSQKPDDNGSSTVTPKTFTVTFNTDGGSEVASQTVEDGKSAAKPDDPTKEGFDFEGWYNGENLYDFASPVTADLTLTAKWEKNLGHEYVDLGLPSGTLWATCNVGAENPWDCGDYFAWGETKTKEVYGRETYIFQESPSTLDADHDAATANWGSEWRMPTQAEFQELKDNCQWEWVEDYNGKGINGYVVYHNDPNTRLFFPAAGYYCDMYDRGDVCSAVSHQGHYWSSSVYNDHTAYQLHLRSDGVHPNYMYHRDDGVTVRPVLCR